MRTAQLRIDTILAEEFRARPHRLLTLAWHCTAREHLDDDHATATAWTTWLVGIDDGGLALRFCSGEQLTRACDVSAQAPLANRP
jgi:hypothetical protein